MVPFIDESVIVGGFHSVGVGVVDSLRAGTIMRERAQQAGALTVSANTELLGIDVERGRVRRVRDDPRRHRGGDRDHRLRRLEPAGRAHGRRVDPAHAGRPPDDRRRPGAAVRRRQVAHRVPDRARHGHQHVRAPGRHRPRDRLLRPPADPARPRGDPLGRGGRALADRVPVHPGGLRAADGARAGAGAGDRRRRVRGREVRDQRPALADPRRHADPRRDARGARPLVGGRGLGQGGPGRRPSRSPSGWSTASRRSISTRPTSPASGSARRRARTCERGRPRAFNKTYGIVHPGEQWASNRNVRLSPVPPPRAGARAPSSTRRPAGSARTGTSRTRRSWRSTATG